MGPRVFVLTMAECVVRVWEFERPEDVFHVVSHILSVLEF